MSRFVCREHPNQAVTWRGTGCPTCEQPRRPNHRTMTEDTNDIRVAILESKHGNGRRWDQR